MEKIDTNDEPEKFRLNFAIAYKNERYETTFRSHHDFIFK